jgi:polysaccharide biosynthesis protein PslG
MTHPKNRLTAVLVATILLALCAAAPARAGVRADFVGISSQDVFAGSPSYRGQMLDRQRAAGVGLVRQTFDWAAIEQAPRRYDFSVYDAYVGAIASRGIRILPVLFNPPSFRSSRPRHHAKKAVYPPRRYGSMGAFAAKLVRRYGPRGSFWKQNPGIRKVPIRAWQVWNEPNLAQYWGPRPNARRYTKLLRTVNRAIKRADRRAEVVTAGLPPTKLGNAIRLGRFIRGMYRAGGRRGFDTLALNAYARNTGELSRTVRSLRRLMRRYHDRRARLWITELGWGTGGPKHRFNVGAAAQGRRIDSALRWSARRRHRYRLRGVVYFQWKDQVPYPPRYKDLWGLHTGLLNLQGQAKPALTSFTRAAWRIR